MPPIRASNGVLEPLISFNSMKFFLVLFALLAPIYAQPRVGFVEVYGNRKIPRDRILKVVGAKAGDPLPASKGQVEEDLEAVSGILRARLEAFCCEAGKPILYVGVEERGAPAFPYRDIPTEEIALAPEILSVYADFTAALNRAARDGDTGEDLSAGHSMMTNIACRVAQERFVGLATLHEEQLRRVLAGAADPEQRAIAAYVIGYAPDKKSVVNDIQQALRDPEDAVRANAARALKAIAVLARKPDSGIVLRATWFVEMLNSVTLSDRIEGSRTLLTMFDELTAQTVLQIKDRALLSLEEMAHWHHLPHALPAYLLLGRVAGIPETEMEQAWSRGDREEMLKRIEKSFRKE